MDASTSNHTFTAKPFGAKAAIWIFAAYLLTQLAVNIFCSVILMSYFRVVGYSEVGILDIALQSAITALSLVVGGVLAFFVVWALVKPYFSDSINSESYISLGWLRSSSKWAWFAASLGAFLSMFYRPDISTK